MARYIGPTCKLARREGADLGLKSPARALDSKTLLPAIKQKMAPASMGGEWYLGVRDLIYRLSSR